MRGIGLFAEQYRELWRTVSHEWRDTESRWRDQKRDQFDNEFWTEFSREAQSFDREIDDLDSVMNEIAHISRC